MSQSDKLLGRISRRLGRRGLFPRRKERAAKGRAGRLKLAALAFGAVLVLLSPYLLERVGGALMLPQQNPTEGSLDIEALVRKVQEEISKSEQERTARGIAPMFELKGFELEIGFVVKRASTSGGKVNYEVFTVDNQLQTGSERTHRLKLVMDVVTSFEGSAESSSSDSPTEGQALGPAPPAKGQK